jgi:hypothetical protein
VDRLFWRLIISLISEMTDTEGRHTSRGWVFFDRDGNISTSFARRLRRTFERRGFGLSGLQDPHVVALLGLQVDEPRREMRVVTSRGRVCGVEAIVYLAAASLVALAALSGCQAARRSTHSRRRLSLGC